MPAAARAARERQSTLTESPCLHEHLLPCQARVSQPPRRQSSIRLVAAEAIATGPQTGWFLGSLPRSCPCSRSRTLLLGWHTGQPPPSSPALCAVLTPIVQASPARPAAHLDVLPTAQPAEGAAIPLAGARERHSLGRHVQTRGKGLSGEQYLQQALLGTEGQRRSKERGEAGQQACAQPSICLGGLC